MTKKLNLGCNDLKLDGFINIDIDPRVKPDMLANCLHLPFEDDSVDEIYAGHLLEHTTPEEEALKEWHRVLKKGGKITITVPDVEKAIFLYKSNELGLDMVNQVVFGANDREQQNHHQVFTRMILVDQMSKYFRTTIVDDSPHAYFKVNWQTIAEGYKV